MKTLVCFYSRTGITRKVGTQIAEALSADVEEIIDHKGRSGPIGFVTGGKDAFLARTTEITEAAKNPADYDMVIIGTPVWAGTMAPAPRTWIMKYAGKVKNMAFFCTTASSGMDKTLAAMEELSGLKASASIGFYERDVKKGDTSERVKQFTSSLTSA
ncbi:MAG: flavodoxin [Planctomycetes bacterium]|nr:flavodoxin [Planctomycetota bacterium]